MVNHNNVSPLKDMKKHQPAKPTYVANGPVEIKVESWLAGSIRKNDHELEVLYSRGCIDVFVRIPGTGERLSAREYATIWRSESSLSKKSNILPSTKVGKNAGPPAKGAPSAASATKSPDNARKGMPTMLPSQGKLDPVDEVADVDDASSTDSDAAKQRRLERAKVVMEERRLEASQLRAERIGIAITGDEKLPEILDFVRGVIGKITGWEEAFLSKGWKKFALDNHLRGYESSFENRRLRGVEVLDGVANVTIGSPTKKVQYSTHSITAGAWRRNSRPSTLNAIAATQTPSRKGGGGAASAKSFARSK